MQVETEVVRQLMLLAVVQTGALIFYCGIVAATLRNHDKRLDIVEKDQKQQSAKVAQIAGKEGFQL